MRWPRFKRRRAWRAEWQKVEVKMSAGWWLTHEINLPDGSRGEMKLLVEPEEIGPYLRVLERNGTSHGRSARVEYGVGQTGRQQKEAALAERGA